MDAVAHWLRALVEELKLFREALQASTKRLSSVHAPSAVEPTDVVTLRDRFAMAALTGLCARSGSNLTPPERTWLAFEYADAAIEAREPKDGAQ